jgi:hypothetical protein
MCEYGMFASEVEYTRHLHEIFHNRVGFGLSLLHSNVGKYCTSSCSVREEVASAAAPCTCQD